MPDESSPKHPTIHDEHLISLVDGKPYLLLLRHMKTHGYTAASYRAAFDLPDEYPMVAPAYSRRRAELSKQIDHSRHWNRYKNVRRSDL